MGKSSINTGFAKCFILFMAIVILVQGCLYLGLSVWGITQENCGDQDMNISENPFQFVLDLIYFIKRECSPVTITGLPGTETTLDLTIDYDKSFMITNRMNIFLIVYAVVSGLWIVASLLVIATLCGPVTKLVSAFCFWPWFLIVIGGSILDAVATGYHISDIVHTTSAEETFHYIGVQAPQEPLLSYFKTFDAYFITPAVVMTCISSRVVIIWLLNIFGTSFCLSLSRVLSAENKHRKHHHHHHHQQTPPPTTQIPATTYAPPTETQIIEQHAVQNRPTPLIIPAYPQQQPEPQQQMQRQVSNAPQQQMSYSPKAPVLTPDIMIMENNNKTPVPSDNTTYRKTDSHPDRLDYPPKTPQTPMSPSAISANSPLASASVLNNRYSAAEGYNPQSAGGGGGGTGLAGQRVSDELRGQLPWSYTKVSTKPPPPPKKPQVQVYPQIPEPDYHEDDNSPSAGSAPPAPPIQTASNGQGYSRW